MESNTIGVLRSLVALPNANALYEVLLWEAAYTIEHGRSQQYEETCIPYIQDLLTKGPLKDAFQEECAELAFALQQTLVSHYRIQLIAWSAYGNWSALRRYLWKGDASFFDTEELWKGFVLYMEEEALPKHETLEEALESTFLSLLRGDLNRKAFITKARRRNPKEYPEILCPLEAW